MSLSPSSKRKSTRPADGERRAVRNLSAQYRVAAALAYDALRTADFEWIRLVNPDAGRLDDVIIARPGRLDAYQVKWSEYRHEVPFRDLVAGSTVSGKPYPSPFSLMADGWRRLRALHPRRRVHAHFLMHDAASARATKDKVPKPAHLQAFLRIAFPARGAWFEPGDGTYAAWSSWIDRIVAETGLEGDDLTDFVRDCELDLGFDLPDAGAAGATRTVDDIDDLAAFFMRKVSEEPGPVELRPEDILRGLRWNDRFELRFKHNFPIDERLYQPITTTIEALDAALDRFSGGYLALVGPPGSGKSTTLTQTLRYRRGVRLIRYYAFVRDDPRGGRGEAWAFLHDLCLSIEALGFGGSIRPRGLPETLHGLRERLGLLLGELGEDRRSSGARTVILVDGLDHIEREQSPDRSLIEELPSPTTVPDGVVVILGTQQIALEGPSAALRPIRTHLAEPGRRLEMGRLGGAAVRAMADAAIAPALRSPGDEAKIHSLCAGHPLSLAYLLKRIAAVADADAAARLLDDESTFGGDVDAEYAAYWDQLARDEGLRDLLALISRLRGPFDQAALKQLAPPAVLRRFMSNASYLFRESTPIRLAFFHNSFRQFVLRRTGVDAFGRPDAAASSDLHRRLASAASDGCVPPDMAWELVYHLEQAGLHEEVVAGCGQRRLRDQFLAGRLLDDLRDDVRSGMRAAAELGDVAGIAGLLLIDKELIERADAVGDLPLADLSVRLADQPDRPGLLMPGDEVLVPDTVALDWAGRLADAGNWSIGLKLFEAAEPSAVLAGVEGVAADDHAVIDAWVAAAWRFRPLGQVVGAISQLHTTFSRLAIETDGESDAAKRDFRTGRLARLGFAIHDAGDEGRFDELKRLLANGASGDDVLFRLDFHVARTAADGGATIEDAIGAARRVLAAAPPSEASPVQAAYLADILIRLPGLEAEADPFMDALAAPIVTDDLRSRSGDPFAPVEPLLRQARSRAARRRPMDPMDIAAPARNRDFGRILFQRLVVIVGTLWGQAIAGRKAAPGEVLRRLQPILALRRRNFREAFDWHDWEGMNAASPTLYAGALKAASAHGDAAFQLVLKAFLDAAKAPSTGGQLGWPPAVRRRTALAAFAIDGDAGRTRALLLELDELPDSTWELHDRLRELQESADAWLVVGDAERARRLVTELYRRSYGIHHHKDRQIQDWVGWMRRLLESGVDPDLADAGVRMLLKLIPTLFEAGRGRGVSEATGELLVAVGRRAPKSAADAGIWLLEEGVANRAAVLAALLSVEVRSGDDRRVSDALVASARLLLPFDGYSGQLGEALRDLAAASPSAEACVLRACSVFRRVADGTAQAGRAYLEDIDGVAARGGSHDDEDDEDEPGVPASLVAADGHTFDQAGLERLAHDPSALGAALAAPRSLLGVDWCPIIRTLFASRPPNAVRSAADVLLGFDLSLPELEVFAECAAAAGEAAVSLRAAEDAVVKGRPYGWARPFDGGSRLAAVRCLLSADPVHGRGLALRLFVRDYIENDLSPGELVASLDELIPALGGDLPLAAIWREIAEHVSALVDYDESRFKPPPCSVQGPEGEVVVSVDLLLRDAGNPAQSLAWQARRGLIDLLELGDPTGSVGRGLAERLAGDFSARTTALAVLVCLGEVRPDLAAKFADQLEPLAWSPFGVVRLAAQRVLLASGRPLPTSPPARPLPALYRLSIPETTRPEVSLTGGSTPAGEPLPDTDDPFDLTRMHHGSLRRMAADTGYSFDLVVRRMAQLMDAVAPKSDWAGAVEQRLTAYAKEVGLKLGYRRPRSLVTQHALGHLVAELCDAGAMAWLPRSYEHSLAVADPTANLVDPVARPEWLAIPGGDELGRHPHDQWLAAVAESLPTAAVSGDGGVVLAELTTIVSQDHDREEESRVSLIAHRDFPFTPDRMPDIHDLFHAERFSGTDYPALLRPPDDIPTTVIAGGAIFASSRFLALNPFVGRSLGWRVDADGLFRWIDEAGVIMAESVCWATGNVDLHDSGGVNHTAAAGWLVLASPAGWVRLRPLLAGFVRHRLAGRMTGLGQDDERAHASARDQVALPG